MDYETLVPLSPSELRATFRQGQWSGSTGGLAPDYLQANLVILRADLANDFEEFCKRNPQPCPLIEVSEPGSTEFAIAPGSNFYTDLPRYRVLAKGEELSSPQDISDQITDDSVGFLLGCSVTFEKALVATGVPVRHLDANQTAPMYKTTIACESVGRFSGHMIVTMRAIPKELVETAARTTAAMPQAHGAPVHIGDPEDIGVDLTAQDFGDPAIIHAGDVPVFWGCGVTPQEIARVNRLDMISHYPGAMFITDQEMKI